MQKQSRLSKFLCFEFSRLKGGKRKGGGGIILHMYAGGGGVNEKHTGVYKGGGEIRNLRFYCVHTLCIPPSLC